jgi:hypothetical protein
MTKVGPPAWGLGVDKQSFTLKINLLRQFLKSLGLGRILWINAYTILSNILLSKLSPYRDEIIGDHQCGVDVKDQIFCIYQILEKK